MGSLRDKIDHVVVVMFENRSFDHLLGFLNHPKGINGLTGSESNPRGDGSGSSVSVNNQAHSALDTDPGHHHSYVMDQLYNGVTDRYNNLEAANNNGFLQNYASLTPNDPEDIMKCFRHSGGGHLKLKTFRKLALDYALCDHWFSSVPGATWPNRQYVHAATSNGKVDNSINFYSNRTIYEAIADKGLQWKIYKDGPAQSQSFYKLWFKGNGGFSHISNFEKDVADGSLANYVFIEPRHFKLGSFTNDMHPANNHDNDIDFVGADNFLNHIYTTLISKPSIWSKTLLVVTFDEHGGFYDHVAPPVSDFLIPDNKFAGLFRFNMLGVRVPTLIISPHIQPLSVDSEVYDHTSIIATARKIFDIPEPLTNRDKHAATFDHLLDNAPRKILKKEIRSIKKLAKAENETISSSRNSRVDRSASGEGNMELNDLQYDLFRMTKMIDKVKAKDQKTVERNLKKLKTRSMPAFSTANMTKQVLTEYEILDDLKRHTNDFDKSFG